MEEKNNKGLIWLIVVLIILFAGLVSIVVYKTLEKEKGNESDASITTTTTTTENQEEINENEGNKGETSELAVLLKEYFIYQEKEEHKDLYQNGNVKYWNINSIKYLGYYKNKSDVKYYAAYGNYKCKDNSAECIYMEQLDDITTGEIPFKVSFSVKNGEIKEILGTIFDDMVIDKEPDASKNFVLKNEIVASNISTKKVDAELIVDTMDNYFNEYKLKKQIDNYSFEFGGVLEKKDYCKDYDKYESLKDRIEIVVSVDYENLVGESFAITGNDDNIHFDNKDYYRAGAVYILVKDGNKYKVHNLYTGC